MPTKIFKKNKKNGNKPPTTGYGSGKKRKGLLPPRI